MNLTTLLRNVKFCSCVKSTTRSGYVPDLPLMAEALDLRDKLGEVGKEVLAAESFYRYN